MTYNLNFHQTFRPEPVHIRKLISFDSLTASMEEISHRFGIPTGKSSGKVEVSLLYAQAAGLLEFKREKGEFIISRTSLGDRIYEVDPFLDNLTTSLLCHYKFCSYKTKMPLWRALFVDYRVIDPVFSTQNFLDFVSNRFQTDNIKTAPLFGTYISEDPLIDLDLIVQNNKDEYTLNRLNVFNSYSIYYAYFIVSELKNIDPNRSDFTLSDLLECGFNRIFGWDQNQLRMALEIIETEQAVILNKQFDNYHIYLNTEIKSIIDKME